MENTNAEYYNMMKFWEKLESKSSYHFPNLWWVRGGIFLNTCHLKKLWRGQEDKRKPWTSELFESETLKQFNTEYRPSTLAPADSYIDTPKLIEIKDFKDNNLVSGQLENFFHWNPSGTFRNIPWHHWKNPIKVPGAPSQGFLIFLVFVKNITKLKNWLSRPHFWANFQVSYHFGKLLTVRSQGHTESKNLSLNQWDISISKINIWTP